VPVSRALAWAHVRNCEGVGVKLPRALQPCYPSISLSTPNFFLPSGPCSCPGDGMRMEPPLCPRGPLSSGTGVGFFRHQSSIPEQRWSGLPEIWREIILFLSSYRACLPISILLPSRRRALSGENSGRGIPKTIFNCGGQACRII